MEEAELETRCPVCLENWDSAAYAMPCCHQFCFHCIQRWTSTRPQCPLCKQNVKSIIHSVQADDNYKELPVRPAAEASIATRSPAVHHAARPCRSRAPAGHQAQPARSPGCLGEWCPGLHEAGCYRQVKGSHPAPLLSSEEATAGALGPELGSPVQGIITKFFPV
uniref:E3 ubiquitin-protein ligase Topors n=1 Tax=Gallus gallus TaxID=9031 RepID=A0A8V0XJM7_CHICK